MSQHASSFGDREIILSFPLRDAIDKLFLGRREKRSDRWAAFPFRAEIRRSPRWYAKARSRETGRHPYRNKVVKGTAHVTPLPPRLNYGLCNPKPPCGSSSRQTRRPRHFLRSSFLELWRFDLFPCTEMLSGRLGEASQTAVLSEVAPKTHTQPQRSDMGSEEVPPVACGTPEKSDIAPLGRAWRAS